MTVESGVGTYVRHIWYTDQEREDEWEVVDGEKAESGFFPLGSASGMLEAI